MVTIIDQVKNFVKRKVLSNVEYFDKNNIYPSELIKIMKSMGLFGMTIPKVYDGLEIDILTRIRVMEELASGWLSLCSLVDGHLRVCDYIIDFGTEEQKRKLLPLLARGKLVAAHANNEKNMKKIESLETYLTNIDGSLEMWTLSGRKEWITNSRNADIFAVSACIIGQHPNIKSVNSCVVLIEKSAIGLSVENDWDRMGVKGISLAPVIFHNCLVEAKNIIGEFRYNGKTLVESSHQYLSMASSARSISASRRLIEKCGLHLLERTRNGKMTSLSEEPTICVRFGQLLTKFQAAESLYNVCCSNLNAIDKSKLISCKIFASETNKEIALFCVELFDGSGYTLDYDIERYVRDSLSLPIIHSSTDISLNNLVHILLDSFQLNKQNPPSIVLHYAPHVIPYIKYECLLQATLEEHEQIIDIGYYRNTSIKLYLYDMTTMSPSATFKDFASCLVFAHCLQNNINCICAQSSGSTAMSLIHYARKSPSIKLILFYLTQNSYKINPVVIPNNVILVEVNSTERDMNHLVKRFSDLTSIPIMPSLNLQIDANKIRAYFINDYSTKNGISFNWYVQSLFSASAPIGLYQGFTDIGQQLSVPKFFGIEQESFHPFTHALGFCENTTNEMDKKVESTEPELLRNDLSESVKKIKTILQMYGGKTKILKDENFTQYLDEAISLLSKNNIHVSKSINEMIFEKGGILALAATLDEINNDYDGAFSGNENILIGITDGTGCPAADKPTPKLILNGNLTDENVKYLLEFS